MGIVGGPQGGWMVADTVGSNSAIVAMRGEQQLFQSQFFICFSVLWFA
jgi:hypothetical protein